MPWDDGLAGIPLDFRHSSLREPRGPCVEIFVEGSASMAIDSTNMSMINKENKMSRKAVTNPADSPVNLPVPGL